MVASSHFRKQSTDRKVLVKSEGPKPETKKCSTAKTGAGDRAHPGSARVDRFVDWYPRTRLRGALASACRIVVFGLRDRPDRRLLTSTTDQEAPSCFKTAVKHNGRHRFSEGSGGSTDEAVGFLRHGESSKNGVANKKAPSLDRAGEHFRRLHPAIPCWVAPLQSPTPFHQARTIIVQQ